MAANGHTSRSPQGPHRNGFGRGTYIEFGREYSIWHKGAYLFPVDEDEMDRMDAMHKFFMVARKWQLCDPRIIDLDNLRSPSNPRNPQILDLGCGTGIWALDVAKKFWDPQAKVFIDGHIQAVDKCLDMQPENIYPNSSFTFVDFEEPWNEIAPDSRHFIHGRLLAGSVQSWPKLYTEACRHLVPGVGWFEQVEVDWDFDNVNGPVSPRLRYWADELLDATDRTGRPLRLDQDRAIQALHYAGLTNIKEEVLHIRVNGGSTNDWEADAGRWFNLSLHKGFMAMSLGPLCHVKGWTRERVDALRMEVLREIGDRNNTSYCRLYIWSAQRPGVPEQPQPIQHGR